MRDYETRCLAKGQRLVTLKTGERVFIDAECIPLVEALNRLPGVMTQNTCSGHGRTCFSIMLRTDSQDRLRPLLRVLLDLPEERRMAFDWRVTLHLNLVHDRDSISLGRPRFRYSLTGLPPGETAYRQANIIAEALTAYRRKKRNPRPPEAENMNRRDYALFCEGRWHAENGRGLSDSPHGGRDGDLWRGGVRSWLDEHGDETGNLDAAGPDPEKTTAQDAPGQAISTRPISGHPPKPGKGRKVGK